MHRVAAGLDVVAGEVGAVRGDPGLGVELRQVPLHRLRTTGRARRVLHELPGDAVAGRRVGLVGEHVVERRKPGMSPPMAMRPVGGTSASSAASAATSASSASAKSTAAPESPRMYASSAAVRWVLSGTYCHPPWNTASNTWKSSAELRVSVATGSNGCTPRARSACTSRFAPASSSPAVHARGRRRRSSATRSGSSRAATQNPLGTCSPTLPLTSSPFRRGETARSRVCHAETKRAAVSRLRTRAPQPLSGGTVAATRRWRRASRRSWRRRRRSRPAGQRVEQHRGERGRHGRRSPRRRR